jgi:hypothetical protein
VADREGAGAREGDGGRAEAAPAPHRHRGSDTGEPDGELDQVDEQRHAPRTIAAGAS